MLVVPRLYAQYTHHRDHESDCVGAEFDDDSAVTIEKHESHDATNVLRKQQAVKPSHPRNMLLLHQTGSVKVGEVVR